MPKGKFISHNLQHTALKTNNDRKCHALSSVFLLFPFFDDLDFHNRTQVELKINKRRRGNVTLVRIIIKCSSSPTQVEVIKITVVFSY